MPSGSNKIRGLLTKPRVLPFLSATTRDSMKNRLRLVSWRKILLPRALCKLRPRHGPFNPRTDP